MHVRPIVEKVQAARRDNAKRSKPQPKCEERHIRPCDYPHWLLCNLRDPRRPQWAMHTQCDISLAQSRNRAAAANYSDLA